MMRGFVASWFFPPQTSAEGLCTYKLLKYSAHEYDVCCSASDLWSYHTVSEMTSDNIHTFPVETDDIDHWVEEAYLLFEKRHAEKPYDFIMTRSMPPESVLFGFRVKEKHPELRWIASFGDPVSRNPYELAAYIDEADLLTLDEKPRFLADLADGNLDPWKKKKIPAVQLLCKLTEWESKALRLADNYIFPTAEQMNYTLKNVYSPKGWAVPHNYDPDLIPPEQESADPDKITITYCGFTDERRSLAPLVNAMHALRLKKTAAFDRLRIRVVGNTPRAILDMVQNFHLEDSFVFEKGVDYATSLKIMAESDWLLHLEAYFDNLEGGSIFFASKLADYFGIRKPILGLCTPHSAAGKMIARAGGKLFPVWEKNELVEFLDSLSKGEVEAEMDRDYCSVFSSPNVAKYYDALLAAPVGAEQYLDSKNRIWPERKNDQNKLISICIPSYNAELYLDRCLLSLVSAENAGRLEVLVVNDGSTDRTLGIAKLYESRYPGIIRVIDKANGGHGSTINAALAEASGKYFMVLDSDDWLNTDDLDKLIRKITEDNLDEDLILTHYYRVDLETGKYKDPLRQEGIPFDEPFRFTDVDTDGMYIALANSLFRLSLLRECKLELQEHTFYVDVEYILFPIPYIDTIRYLDYSLYRYCVGNENQSISTASMVKRYDHHERVMKRVVQYYATVDTAPEKKAYMRGLLKKLLGTHYKICLYDDWDKQRGLARAKEFDAFLKQASRQLYHDAGKQLKGLSGARLKGFRYRPPFSERLGAFSRTGIGHALVYNKVTHVIANGPLIRFKPFERLVLTLVKNKPENLEDE